MIKKNPSKNQIRRYTNLASLFNILQTRKLTLLDPKGWDDSNDSHFILKYKERKKLRTVLALCLTEASETYHHWKVFSSGPDGVCIVLRKNAFLQSLQDIKGIETRKVKYKTIEKLKADRPLEVDDFPFLKRYAYRGEEEYRIIYTSALKCLPSKDLDFELSNIECIVLSPWMHRNLHQSVKMTIRSIEGCSELRIIRSSLIGNTEWKQLANEQGGDP